MKGKKNFLLYSIEVIRLEREEKLAAALKEGNTAALEKIMKTFSAYVCAVLRNFSRGSLSEEDIDELCADVFINLWQNRQSLLPETGLRAYLSASARNAVKNRFRQKKPSFVDIEDADISSEYSVENAAELSETLAALEKGISELSEDEREIFLRYYFYGEKLAEISSIMKIPENTLRPKLSRTRKKLKNYLTERGFDNV